MDADLRHGFDELQAIRQLFPDDSSLEDDFDHDHLRIILGPDLYDEWLAATRIRISTTALMKLTMESWQHNLESGSQIIRRMKDCVTSASSQP